MVSMCLRKTSTEKRNPFGITPAALDNLTTEHLEQNWSDCQKTILETIKFLADQKIVGPGMLPFAYLALPVCSYFHENRSPNRELARQWFWRMAFVEDFRNSTLVYEHASGFFAQLEANEPVEIAPLTLSLSQLVQASYYYRNTLSRAVLAWLANQRPVDFSDPQAEVLDNVYLLMSQAPNLHHIYPQNFLRNVPGLPSDASPDSLMNICFLRAKTNIQISDKNPLDYFQQFRDVRGFSNILDSHLIPRDYIERDSFLASDYRAFLYTRAAAFCESLKAALPNVKVTIAE
jgi:hypothetical protein